MPLATNSLSLARRLPIRTRWLLLAVTLVWLIGCAFPNVKKGAARSAAVHGDKFSCGEDCPKGRTP